MIVTSRPMQVTAVALAAGLHIAAFQSFDLSEDIQIAAAGAMQEVSLGNAFADLVAGVMTAETVENLIEPVAPVTEPQRTDPVETAPRETETAAGQPQPVELQDTPTPTETAQTEPVPTDTALPSVTETATVTTLPSQNAIVAANPVVPDQPEPLVATNLAPTTPATALKPTAPTTQATEALAPVEAAPAPEVETLTGEDASITAPLRSTRPSVRPEGLAPPPPPRQDRTTQQQTQPRQQASQPRGNAQQNANQGAQTETPRANAAASSGSNESAGQSSAASNAAVSNYPGQVLRRVSRVRRPRTNARGAAIVDFSIASNGRLAGVSIGRSSGNAELDAMAIQVVQRAAPFPLPPAGAQTRFRIEVTGR